MNGIMFHVSLAGRGHLSYLGRRLGEHMVHS